MSKAASQLQSLVAEFNQSGRAAKVLGSTLMVVELHLQGEEPFHLILGNGQIQLGEGSHIRPTLTLAGDSEAWGRVVKGETDITHPLARGQLKLVKGKFLDNVSLSRILAAVTAKGS